MPLGRASSSLERTMERYTQRSELMARKRALTTELEEQRSAVQKTQDSLQAVEKELRDSYADITPR